jgi:hypothetical protein
MSADYVLSNFRFSLFILPFMNERLCIRLLIMFHYCKDMPASKLKFLVFLQQGKDSDKNCISEIPVSSNEENQSLPVEVQVKEHILRSDSSDDQRSVVNIPIL